MEERRETFPLLNATVRRSNYCNMLGSDSISSSQNGWNDCQPNVEDPSPLASVRASSGGHIFGVPAASASSCVWQHDSIYTNHQAASSIDLPVVKRLFAAEWGERVRRGLVMEDPR